jgi:hypothetical protein
MMSSSQFYGAGEFLEKPRGLLPNASWTHGIIFCPVSPYQIISREDSIFDYHLVTDEIQAEIAGRVFDNVVPVGLPFAHAFDNLYCSLKLRDINRLFLSSHSISGEKESSLQGLFKLAKGFECDAIILPGHQFESAFGSLLNEAIYSDIRVFRGAFPKDFDSYKRIISLFSRTNTLVTDCAGSHIYYAAACDCQIQCELTEITESLVYEKIQAVSIGLNEPWLSAMKTHFIDYKKTEIIVREFMGCSPAIRHEIALEKIGHKFIGNLDEIRNKIQNTSLPTLLMKNLNMLLVKIDARWG